MAPLPSQAAIQQIDGNPVQIKIADNASPAILVKAPGSSTYTAQYWGQWAWGSVVWLNGADITQQYDSGYISSTLFTPVSNSKTVVGTTSTITTVVDLGISGVRLTQQFTYVDGERTVAKQWTFVNTGATTYNDLRFFHGGDASFGGLDSAYGFYNAANTRVYLRNADYTDWGLMAFYANPATPASRYFEGYFATGKTQAGTDAQLGNTVDAIYQDAGYYLQWNRASLAPGEIWTIQAAENWTAPGALQVLAPANQEVTAGSALDLFFTVQNLADAPIEVALSAGDSAGWGASISGSAAQTIAANGNISVPVHVNVPAGLSAGEISNVSLSANDGTATQSAASRLTIAAASFSLNPSDAAFGAIPVGSSSVQTVTITNTSDSGITLGSLGSLAAPFSTSLDTCSGQSLAAGGTCTFDVSFSPTSVGAFRGSLAVPMVAPAIVSTGLKTSGTSFDPAPAPTPVPGFYGLRVAVSGQYAASGTITSKPVGLDCGTVCEGQFAAGSAVYLTATPKPGSVFADWMNCDIVQKDKSCLMSMDGPKKEVVAFFRPATAATPVPGATATPVPAVTPAPTAAPTPVPTAAPTPEPTAAPSPTPTPVPAPTSHQVVLSVVTVGEGVVNSSAGGVDCGSVCNASFDVGSAVTLTAVPAEGYKFKRWIGAGCGSTSKKLCTVKLNKSKTVTAKFVKKK